MDDFTLVNKIVLFVAKRCSGKSVLMKQLIEDEANEFHKIYCICPTEDVNHFYSKSGLVKPECIFESWSEVWAEKFLKYMTQENADKTPDKQKKVLLIMDDCIADVAFKTSPSLKKIITRGRHISISLIFSTQYLNSISPLQRNNSDYILVGQMNNHSVEILEDEYRSGDISKADFVKLYHDNTKNFGFLVINNTSSKTDDINEIYGVVRATV